MVGLFEGYYYSLGCMKEMMNVISKNILSIFQKELVLKDLSISRTLDKTVESQAFATEIYFQWEYHYLLSPNGHGILDHETRTPLKHTKTSNFSN